METETKTSSASRMPGGKAGTGEKSKNFKQSIMRLIAYLKPYIWLIVLAMVLSIASTIMTLIGPNQIQKIAQIIQDGLKTSFDMTAIVQVAMFVATIYIIGFICNYAQGFIMATVTQKTAKNLRSDIFDKINRIPLSYFDKNSYGNVMSRVTNDVDTVSQTLNQSLSSFLSSAIMFVGALFFMLITNVTLTIAAVVATAIGFILIMVIVKKSQKYFRRQQNELGNVNGYIEEVYSGLSIVKAYNGDIDARKNFDKMNTSLKTSAQRAQFLSGLMPSIMSFISNLGYVTVCVVGATMVVSGRIQFDVIIAFIMYVRLFTQPLSSFAQITNSLQSAAAASERIFEFMDEPELSNESNITKTLTDVEGNVKFEHVGFHYTEDKEIIHDFSADVFPGQKIAIVGPTGAGKTTMINLLMRFYEVNRGAIKIDDVSTKEITRENVHSLFSMVLQDTWLFEGTVRDNLIFNQKNVSDEQIIQACKVAGIHHFICTLPKGYDTILNESAGISEGQKQLMTIARAMIQDAPMLILDEATSSVDTRTEVLIQEAMDQLTVGRTSFVIAHRLSTIKNADLILVMKDGDIIEKGTHEELLAQKQFYADLYMSQFEHVS